MKKGLDERIDEGVHWWFSHVKRMEKNRIAKRVYVGEYAGSHSVRRLQKRWIDTVKEYLKKRGLDVWKARRMVGVYEGECMGHNPGDKPLILMKCQSCRLPQLYEALEEWKSICG